MKLIAAPTAANALAFAFRHVVSVLKEHWWFYLGVFVLDLSLGTWNASHGSASIGNAVGLASFPALAAATRLAYPSFRMDSRVVFGLIGLSLLIVVAFGFVALFGVFLAFIARPIMPLIVATLAALCVWAGIKLGAATALYTLEDRQDDAIMTAVRRSWNFVFGGIWWNALGMTVATAIASLLVAMFFLNIAAGLVHSPEKALVPSVAIESLLEITLIAGTVLSSIAWVALASTAIEETDVQTQTAS